MAMDKNRNIGLTDYRGIQKKSIRVTRIQNWGLYLLDPPGVRATDPKPILGSLPGRLLALKEFLVMGWSPTMKPYYTVYSVMVAAPSTTLEDIPEVYCVKTLNRGTRAVYSSCFRRRVPETQTSGAGQSTIFKLEV